ncbi:MAG: hypothetical protein KIS96_11225 [Bauldia sp.]|nr:hypothetical protein [Bauldia sp.]
MATEIELTKATPADLAADMEHHRQTYSRFMNILRYSIVGVAVILTIIFFIYV